MTPPHDPSSAFATAPLPDLLDVLLRQYRRPLAAHRVMLVDADARAIAEAWAAHAPLPPTTPDVLRGVLAAIDEADAVLAALNLDYATALQTAMSALPGWETTAEFLALANDKANAELRISAGAALALALGDARHADRLRFLAAHPHLDDVSAVFARRVLAHHGLA